MFSNVAHSHPNTPKYTQNKRQKIKLCICEKETYFNEDAFPHPTPKRKLNSSQFASIVCAPLLLFMFDYIRDIHFILMEAQSIFWCNHIFYAPRPHNLSQLFIKSNAKLKSIFINHTKIHLEQKGKHFFKWMFLGTNFCLICVFSFVSVSKRINVLFPF